VVIVVLVSKFGLGPVPMDCSPSSEKNVSVLFLRIASSFSHPFDTAELRPGSPLPSISVLPFARLYLFLFSLDLRFEVMYGVIP